MEQIGRIYRDVRQMYENDISVTYMDPRNHFAIAGYLLGHWKNGSLRPADLLRSFCFGIHRGAVFYNGFWLNPDRSLDEREIVERIERIRRKGEGECPRERSFL